MYRGLISAATGEHRRVLRQACRRRDMAAVDRVADVVVMASHGRTGMSRVAFGSVTGAVLRDGCTPVMVVHAPPTPTSAVAAAPVDRRVAIHV